MIICDNCGGSFNNDLPKCPYCGALNPEGAEKEYSEKLENLRVNLDNVDEQAKEAFMAEVKTFFRVLLITVAVVGVFALFSFSTKNVVSTVDHAALRTKTDEKIALISEAHELTSVLDEYYDNGLYEKAIEKINETRNKYASELYDWKHNAFMNTYRQIHDGYVNVEAFKNETTHSTYRYQTLLYQSIYSYYLATSDGYASKYVAGEQEILLKECETLENQMLELLELDRKDYEALRLKVIGGGYPQRTDVDSFCEERWGK